jgi:YidC/Oxa1 family membrane protein insertase
METTRFILLLSFGLVLMMIWQAWQEDYGLTPQQGTEKPEIVSEQQPAPDIPTTPAAKQQPQLSSAQQPATAPLELQGERLKVNTDVYHIEIDTLGGSIKHVSLTGYPESKDKPDVPFIILDDNSDLFFIAQGGLLGQDGGPTHEAQYQTEQTLYSLSENKNSLDVPLRWVSSDGITVTKIYTFYRGRYLFDVTYKVENGSTKEWSGRAYGQLQRNEPGSRDSHFIYTYTGAVLSSPEKRYEKIKFEDIKEEKLNQNITNGWAAMLQHYFLAALIPGSSSAEYNFYTLALENSRYVIGSITPILNLKAGETDSITHKLYIGPKTQKELNKIAEGLELTVDYGVFWFIAKPLFWCMDSINLYTKNWGWSIILVTILLKIIFYKLSAAGYRSMANMRRVQPRLLAIRDRYKDDRTRLNKAMMEIYQKEKINPLGGCFPILIQIPVFISLYWVLLESVEMRQAPFTLWINDLSSPDPYFVLPVIMGISMYIQQKLNPAPMDPVQEKVMSMLPIIFTVFFAFFPSGLVLYWVVNNILSIAQQWLIIRNLERSGLKT